MTEEQIKVMVNRFLMWKLPEDFRPDGGISFKATFNENTPHPTPSTMPVRTGAGNTRGASTVSMRLSTRP